MLEVCTLTTPIQRCIYQGRMVDSPAVRQLIAEAEALSAALAYVEQRGNREEAVRRVEQALRGHEGSDLAAVVVRYAMERILDREHDGPPTVETSASPLERHIFETVALAWLRWTTGQDTKVAQEELRGLQEEDGGFQPQGGALHLMSLRPWQFAVQALLAEDPEEARRLFRRSGELGSQCGTETNPVVQWTYAATFWS